MLPFHHYRLFVRQSPIWPGSDKKEVRQGRLSGSASNFWNSTSAPTLSSGQNGAGSCRTLFVKAKLPPDSTPKPSTFQAHIINTHQLTEIKAKGNLLPGQGISQAALQPNSPVIVKQIFTSQELCKLLTKWVKSDRDHFEVGWGQEASTPDAVWGCLRHCQKGQPDREFQL